MSDKTKNRDILADILNDPHTGTIRGMDELNKLIHAPAAGGRSVKTATAAPAGRKKKARPGMKRKKSTHYLTKEVFDNLGEAKEGIKDLLPAEAKSKATKSRIVESAITVVLNEFEAKGKDSALIQEILKKQHE